MARSKFSKKITEYGRQLAEKQKAKWEYGLREKQFRNYYLKAVKSKRQTSEVLLQLLERRLDNVLYRLGWTLTRNQARQLVSHRHIKVNGKIVNIPSYLVKVGDTVEPKKKEMLALRKVDIPAWLELDKKNLIGKVKELPNREMISTDIDETMIIEFYSR